MKNYWRRTVSIIAIASLINGCAPSIKVMGGLPQGAAAKPAGSSLHQCTAALKEVRINSVMVADQATREHFLKQLRQGELFGQVMLGETDSSPSACSFEINLVLKEKIGGNLFTNGMKAFFVGFSLFILTPVLPMKYTFASDMTMDIISKNGRTWTFQSEAKGKAGVPMLYPEGNAVNALIIQVRERNFALITRKIYQDEEFLGSVPK